MGILFGAKKRVKNRSLLEVYITGWMGETQWLNIRNIGDP